MWYTYIYIYLYIYQVDKGVNDLLKHWSKNLINFISLSKNIAENKS